MLCFFPVRTAPLNGTHRLSYDTRPRSASLLAKTKAIKGQTCVAAVVEVGLKFQVVVAQHCSLTAVQRKAAFVERS